MDVRKIAVLGAGAMGSGIAQVAACSGFAVELMDLEREMLERSLAKVRHDFERGVCSGKLSERAAAEALSRISTTTSIAEACRQADLVIESVPENLDLKKSVFGAADAAAPPHAVLASNTAQLSVTAMGAATGRPDRVVGMHWFNPPATMRLIEVARGVFTSDETVAVVRAVAERMGKTVIVCRDAQGFVTSRALGAHLLECIRLFEEGVASAQEIDTAIKLGLGYPMGPLELADHVGLDVIYQSALGLAEAFGDRFRPPQTLVKLVEAGHLGVKTGRGFHAHGT
ncbi:MAG: 3-hydroxyacyl-CoA dehydrogenase family protein [Myxococcales bacterium]|nr:3-hydroxyacyl-CoA dehydrogenase family protein [Myxococcales bacterium]